MGRISKTVAAIGTIVLAVFCVNVLTTHHSSHPKEPSLSVNRNEVKNVHPRRQVASIVYLGATGLPPATISNLKEMHSTEVYLYVAYHSDAYYRIPKNNYGLAQPADSLGPAVRELHQNGFKVVAVISSALIDPKSATAAGKKLLQPGHSIFDPKAAAPFLQSMVQSLVKYNVDGIYVGEPYFTTAVSNPTQAQKQEWITLYRDLLYITDKANVPMDMVLPDLYASGVTVQNVSGLPTNLTKLGFDRVGIDMEDADQGFAQDITRFQNAVKLAKSLSGKRGTIIEVSLRAGNLVSPVSTQFFSEELQTASKYNVQTILIFANEWWSELPNSNQVSYANALQKYLNSSF